MGVGVVRGARQLVLVRHGACAHTTLSLPAPVDGTPGTLTEHGWAQARACGRRLAEAGFEVAAVCASPTERTLRTAELLGLPGEITPCPDLAERDWGTWFAGAEGKEAAERHARARELMRADPWGWRPQGGESLREVRDRVGAWVTAALTGLSSGALVAVSHGEAILAARMVLEHSWRAHPLALPQGPGHALPHGGALVYRFAPGAAVPGHRRLIADPLAPADGRAGADWQRLSGNRG
ncbi:Broad specificity phosphatase PhoE [Actinacidiphila yanglinensis]|uniref:Broad specificity phosphatase PhoE n=1 Tax=Actinacidiphila yanglinensis TaxID=310779 RepID=A0A1H6E937_9ACTN|nr:histidine phosphatase family protein [Actinacidiphila yanglinensis]SEG94227.1 Broad specificity phosphatase PhoE [Actinacidiphila yanglinensis]